MQDYDVVIVGAGITGLSAAAGVIKQGLRPLVVEQHNLPGGFATSIVRGRFEFDATLHCMMYDQLFKRVFGDELALTEKFYRCPEVSTIGFKRSDGTPFSATFTNGDIQKFAGEVEAALPGCGAKAAEYLGVCMELLGGAQFAKSPQCTPELLNEKFPNFLSFSQMNALEVFDALGTPEEVRGLFNQFYWYIGPSLEDYNAVQYAGIVFTILMGAKDFPAMTSHGFLSEMEKIIRDGGGDIWYNTKVEEILIEHGKAVGIRTTRNDVIYTKHIISSVSPRLVLENLIKEKNETIDKLLERQKTLHENQIFGCVYLGLNAPYEEVGLKAHHIFITETLDPMESYEASYTMSHPYCIGGLCPNLTDPEASPEGTCILSLSVPLQGTCMEGLSQEEYFKKKDEFAKDVIDVTNKYLGINLYDYIEEIEVATPATFARYTGSRNGVIGYSQILSEIDATRAAADELNAGAIEGISFVGQFATSFGYPGVNSGYEVGTEVSKKLKGEA